MLRCIFLYTCTLRNERFFFIIIYTRGGRRPSERIVELFIRNAPHRNDYRLRTFKRSITLRAT